jgi:small multidrug resistance pump
LIGWVFLGLAIAFEVIGTIALRYSNGFKVLLPSVLVVIGYGASFYFLALALKQRVPLSSAYAIWSAVGTAVIAAAGVLLFSERINALKIIGIAAIIVGVVALNLGGARH